MKSHRLSEKSSEARVAILQIMKKWIVTCINVIRLKILKNNFILMQTTTKHMIKNITWPTFSLPR